MDGVDTRVAQLDQPMVANPLEKFLGIYQKPTNQGICIHQKKSMAGISATKKRNQMK
jgi:hypothetical protein